MGVKIFIFKKKILVEWNEDYGFKLNFYKVGIFNFGFRKFLFKLNDGDEEDLFVFDFCFSRFYDFFINYFFFWLKFFWYNFNKY